MIEPQNLMRIIISVHYKLIISRFKNRIAIQLFIFFIVVKLSKLINIKKVKKVNRRREKKKSKKQGIN
jgi:hypothetical protein